MDAGDASSASAFDGMISINGTSCQQYPYSSTSPWPSAYWDCTAGNTTVIPTVPNTAANLVQPAYVLQPLATSGNVYLYAMNSLSAWNSYFGSNPAHTGNVLGVTYGGASGTIYSTVFAQDSGGSTNGYPDAATAHELGHALDYLWNVSGNVGSGTFGTAVNNDLSDSSEFNTLPCDVVFSGTAVNCEAYPPGYMNSEIYLEVFLNMIGAEPVPNAEFFAVIFEHNQTNDFNGIEGWEYPLPYFENMNEYMQTAITTSSHP